MLEIRPAQMKVFEEASLRRFEDEMVVHSTEFSPRLCEVLGEEQLRVALRQAMARAGDYGFTCRGPLRLFVEMMFLFGSDFDTDPQYPWAAEILNGSDDQMQRSEKLCETILDYQKEVSGPDAANTRRALAELLALTQKPVAFSPNEFVAGMRREMHRVFPQKTAYIGDQGVTLLIQEGRAKGQKYRFPIRGEMAVVVLMFAFGHGCTGDALYPWIARTLEDERIVEPAARAERLEKKSVTWLNHVLALPRAGAAT